MAVGKKWLLTVASESLDDMVYFGSFVINAVGPRPYLTCIWVNIVSPCHLTGETMMSLERENGNHTQKESDQGCVGRDDWVEIRGEELNFAPKCRFSKSEQMDERRGCFRACKAITTSMPITSYTLSIPKPQYRFSTLHSYLSLFS
jgi:hypothetical protein